MTVDYGEKWESIMDYVGLNEGDLKNFDTFSEAVKRKDYQNKMGAITGELQRRFGDDNVARNNQEYSDTVKDDIRDASSLSELDDIEVEDDYEPETKRRIRVSLGNRRNLLSRAEANREELAGFDFEDLQGFTKARLRAQFATEEEIDLIKEEGVKPEFGGSGL